MKVYLIGKTLAPMMRWNGKELVLPGKAEGSAFQERISLEESPYGYHSGQELIEFAGRLCYESFDLPNPKTATNSDYIQNVISLGHESVLEHASVTFYVEGVSRTLSHELIRHRHLSFSELSQRYVDMNEANFVLPPGAGAEWKSCTLLEYDDIDSDTHPLNLYNDMAAQVAGSKKEKRQAARYYLPAGMETKFVVSGNLRAWRDVLKKRLSVHADAEMQQFATAVHDVLLTEYPDVFADIDYETE